MFSGGQIRARSSSSVTDVGFGEAELDELVIESPVSPAKTQSKRSGSFSGLICSAALVSCLGYSFFSIAMTLVNKLILTTYNFNYHMLLLLYQNGTCVVLLQIARYMGLAQFESIEMNRLIAWVPLNLLFVLMLLTGFFSLNLLSVPMATIFKNSTNVLITVGDVVFYGQSVSRGIAASLCLMLLGAVLAGGSDLEFNVYGYFWATANCVITAAYVLYMPRAIADSKLNAFGRVYYNNLLSLPFVLVVDVLVYNDIGRVLSGESPGHLHKDAGFVAAVLFSGCIGFFLSLSSFQCVQSTSPTTYSMVGAMNKIPLAFLGVIIFHTQLNLQSAMFIMLSLVSGILYAYAKATGK